MKKILLIDHLVSGDGPTETIQRTFWREVCKNGDYYTIVISEPGSYETGFANRVEMVERKKWITPFLKLFSGLGVPDLSHIPDNGFYDWVPKAYKKAKKICREEKIDCIYSLSWPCSTHLVAAKIKKETGLPWIACFYDPWIDHVAMKHRFSFFRDMNARMERDVANNADIIIHTNQRMCDIWEERYGGDIKKKMKVLPLCYKIDELPAIRQHVQSDKLLIAHIGGIYGSRHSDDLWNAIDHINNVYPDLAGRIEVMYVGYTTEKKKVKKFIDLRQQIFFKGRLHPSDLDDFYNCADIFLLLDMDIQKCPFFPSKLMMYEYYRKPILGITTKGSVMEQELRAGGYPVFYYGDHVQIESFLIKALENRGGLESFRKDLYLKYDVRIVASEFKHVLNDLIQDE